MFYSGEKIVMGYTLMYMIVTFELHYLPIQVVVGYAVVDPTITSQFFYYL